MNIIVCGAIVVAWLIIMATLTEHLFWGWASMLLCGGIWLFIKSSGVNPVDYVVHQPWTFATYCLEYIAIGVAWMVFKWWRYCTVKAKHARQDFYSRWRTPDTGRSVDDEWNKERNKYRPLAALEKERIITWGYLWPFSLLATVSTQLLRDIWSWMFGRCERLLDAISEFAFKTS